VRAVSIPMHSSYSQSAAHVAAAAAAAAAVQFLRRKWAREHEYKLRKYLWAFRDNRISVCFEYEYRDNRCGRFTSCYIIHLNWFTCITPRRSPLCRGPLPRWSLWRCIGSVVQPDPNSCQQLRCVVWHAGCSQTRTLYYHGCRLPTSAAVSVSQQYNVWQWWPW
jgi:hypothetical protein